MNNRAGLEKLDRDISDKAALNKEDRKEQREWHTINMLNKKIAQDNHSQGRLLISDQTTQRVLL